MTMGAMSGPTVRTSRVRRNHNGSWRTSSRHAGCCDDSPSSCVDAARSGPEASYVGGGGSTLIWSVSPVGSSSMEREFVLALMGSEVYAAGLD